MAAAPVQSAVGYKFSTTGLEAEESSGVGGQVVDATTRAAAVRVTLKIVPIKIVAVRDAMKIINQYAGLKNLVLVFRSNCSFFESKREICSFKEQIAFSPYFAVL